MLIEEDYFKDLEVTDDDIQLDDVIDDKPVERDPNDLDYYFRNKYNKSIIIKTKSSVCFNEYTDEDEFDLFWYGELPELLKRIKRVLDFYYIEYEYIITDDDKHKENLSLYDISDFKVLSSENQHNFSHMKSSVVYIVFYAKFPKFSYKESYRFTDIILKAIWPGNYDTYFESLVISMEPYSLYDFGKCYNGGYQYDFIYTHQEYRADIVQNHEFNFDSRMIKLVKYALPCFNNTREDITKIYKMLRYARRGENPFKNK